MSAHASSNAFVTSSSSSSVGAAWQQQPPLSSSQPQSHCQPHCQPHHQHAASAYPAGPPPRRQPAPPSFNRTPASLDPQQLTTAVHNWDIPAIIDHLYAEQQRLRHLAAVELHAHMTQVAADIIQLTTSPHHLTLAIIQHSGGGVGRRGGCWVDLPTLLLQALNDHRQLTNSAPFDAQLITSAAAVLHSVQLSARSFALFLRVFNIPFTYDDRLQVVEQRLAAGERREAGEFAIRLDVLSQLSDDRQQQLLSELVRGQEVDTIHKYVDALSDECRERWLSYVVEQTADESGGNNVTAACRLIAHYGRRLIDYPHVAHLKAKHELWWACRIGKSDEFAHLLLSTGDVRLQRSLIRQLSRGRYYGDIDRMYDCIQRYGLAGDADVQTVVQQVQLSPPQPQFSTSVTTETTEERAAPTFSIPPADITFVDSESTITHAVTVLSRHTGEESVLGLDCEYLPEPYFQLGVGSSTTQLLQIACSEHTFLIDLQRLSPPTPPHVSERLVDLLCVVLSSEAVKLGIGFEDDMRRLRADFSHLACFQVSVRRYCDLKPLLRMDESAGGGGRDSGGQRRGGKRGERRSEKRRGKRRAKESGTRTDNRDDGKTEADGLSMETGRLEEWQQADAAQKQQLQPAMMKREGGLARLCRVYTGCRLDKTCQIGNWSRRPLTAEQSMYAACDAYVQLLVYAEAMKRNQQLEETQIDG